MSQAPADSLLGRLSPLRTALRTSMAGSQVLAILDLLDGADVRCWLAGGWGVDALVGHQTRGHADVDVILDDFDSSVERATRALGEHGFTVREHDRLPTWMPDRWLLEDGRNGQVELVSFDVDRVRRAFALEAVPGRKGLAPFDTGTVDGREVPCLSADAQRIVHGGYPARPTDGDDLALLDGLDGRSSPSGKQQGRPADQPDQHHPGTSCHQGNGRPPLAAAVRAGGAHVRDRLRPTLDLLPPRQRDGLRELGGRARSTVRTVVPVDGAAEQAAPGPRRRDQAPARTNRIRRANVLMYHRVADEPDDPYALCVAPDRFSEQLRVLSSRAEVVSLDEIVQPRRRPTVAVTFDDGYADNLLNALPALERFGVPATVFVTSRMVGSPTGFWWDRLARALLRPEQIECSVALPDGRLPVTTGAGAAGRVALASLRLRLLPLPVEQIDAVVAQLCADIGAVTEATGPRTLTDDELRRLARHPLVTIGAHTTNHPCLRAQSRNAQLDSIATSKADLESVLGVEVRHFAYPYGNRASFDRRTTDIVRRSGFATACSALPGCVTRWSDPLCLPRREVLDWSADAFGAELGWWGVP